jgi:anionic cell wall polymer biosynthesis LytR-Cps2A-Psr (LCP) family protein
LLVSFFINSFHGSKMVYSFLQNPEENLVYSNGRTNVLLLGIGGEAQYGADLTDTIIFASINIKTGDTVIVSVPRDIWSDYLKAKINTAYHYGEERQTGGGFILAKQSIEEIIGQPIHYTFLLDFKVFVEAIDLLGGIDVEVDQAFDDYKYPIEGKENDDCNGDPDYKCRYEHLHFDEGLQKMDGKTALKFVRSRNAQGEEGTDFSRSQRQQKVIVSLKDKLSSMGVLLNPAKLQGLMEIAKKYLNSNPKLKDEEIASFANIFYRFMNNKSEIRTLTLDTGTPESPGFLVNPLPSEKYSNQWVLVPAAGNWQEFQNYFEKKIKNGY